MCVSAATVKHQLHLISTNLEIVLWPPVEQCMFLIHLLLCLLVHQLAKTVLTDPSMILNIAQIPAKLEEWDQVAIIVLAEQIVVGIRSQHLMVNAVPQQSATALEVVISLVKQETAKVTAIRMLLQLIHHLALFAE